MNGSSSFKVKEMPIIVIRDKKGDTMKEVWEQRPNYDNSIDLRGEPTYICICGSKFWNLKVSFDQESGEIEMFFMVMECIVCGSIATTPTP